MKLLNFIKQPKSFSNVVRQSLDELSGNTSLQLRHKLKDDWNSWISVVKDRGIYEDVDNIIFRTYFSTIKGISKIKPSDIVVPETGVKDNIETTYNDLTNLIEDHKDLTINALLWATLCKNGGEQLKFKDYLVEKKQEDMKLSDKKVEFIKGLLADKQMSKSTIASRMGVSVTYIKDIDKGARRENVKGPEERKKYPPLEKYGQSRDVKDGEISDQGVRDIRKRVAAGEKLSDLAKEYDCTARHIRDIAEKKRRANVPD